MRTGSSDIDRGTGRRRAVPPLALLVLASLSALSLLAGGAPAETLQEEYQRKQAELSDVEAKQGDLAATIAEQNRQVNDLIVQVAEIQARAEAVERKLAAKQSKLDRARPGCPVSSAASRSSGLGCDGLSGCCEKSLFASTSRTTPTPSA